MVANTFVVTKPNSILSNTLKEHVHFLRDYFVYEYIIASIIDLLLLIQNKTKIRNYRL